jgi:hypothetical protein
VEGDTEPITAVATQFLVNNVDAECMMLSSDVNATHDKIVELVERMSSANISEEE